jgi:GAF domain-containing protein
VSAAYAAPSSWPLAAGLGRNQIGKQKPDSRTDADRVVSPDPYAGRVRIVTLALIFAVAALVLGAWEVTRQSFGSEGWGVGIAAIVLGGLTATVAAFVMAARPRYEAATEADERTPPALPEERRPTLRPEALVRVAARLNAAADLSSVVNAVTEETASAVQGEAVVLFLVDRARDEMVVAGAHALPESLRHLWPTLTPGNLEEMFAGSRTLVVPDMDQPDAVAARAVYAALGIHAFALVRMGRGHELIGALGVLSLSGPREFDEAALQLLRCIADQATQAVANAWLLSRADRRLRLTQALRNIDIAIAGSIDVRVTLTVILDEVARQLRIDACNVLLLDPRTQLLRCAASRGFRSSRIEQVQKRVGEGPAGRAAWERCAVGVIDLESQSAEFTNAEVIEGEGFLAYYALPLIAKGHVKGVLEVYHRGPLQPDADWLEFAEALAGQAAIALDNAALFEEMQRLNTSLIMAYDSTLEGWSRALDLRDHETEGHTQRVTEITIRLARALNYAHDELTHVRRGAILHDIGKMGIPDNILLKPGPLTEGEWAVMRRHPVLAYELLSPIPYLRPALEIPYCHHERWDGTGYPRGLRGDQIPLAARIFAVADVWDALRSDRPYREAWSTQQAREYIRSLAGTHFDPQVVSLFERVYDA